MAEEVGNLYYFNATPRLMGLLLNNHILNAEVGGVKKTNGYQPTSHTGTRVAAEKSREATFGELNELVVELKPGGSQTYSLDIDINEFPLEEDLVLYIFYNQIVLVSSTGKARSAVFNGSKLSDAEAEELFEKAGAES